MNPAILDISLQIKNRSLKTRQAYLADLASRTTPTPQRQILSPSNLAHVYAAESDSHKIWLSVENRPNLGIVTAYNDMLSAHQPLGEYPKIIKQAAQKLGITVQVAGGVPAMCDGVTQGQAGMELSLYSRDVIALSTSVALSHNAFDGVIALGVCDKIVPGLLMGALNFGHLPCLFLPAGPMTTGISNEEKAQAREKFAEGKISQTELVQMEMKSYHSQGTCTFYGTANTNQMMLEAMGLQVPASAFVNAGTPLRQAIIEEATRLSTQNIRLPEKAIGQLVNEESLINAMVAILATGGSTNHTIHLIAIARAAGVILTWDDFDALAKITPLLARLYPNGQADVNDFTHAGGTAWVIQELLEAGLLFEDIETIAGHGLRAYTKTPVLENDTLTYMDTPRLSANLDILRPVINPFSATGGIKVLKGNIGEAIVKVSAVTEAQQTIKAPAKVFASQKELLDAFDQGLLQQDFVAVLPNQGPSANGMPELHKLTPVLSVLQKQGFKVALLTDGRMSGASGSVLAAIHVVPEAVKGGMIGKIIDDDLISIDAQTGIFEVEIADDVSKNRNQNTNSPENYMRHYFGAFSNNVSPANEGACILFTAKKP